MIHRLLILLLVLASVVAGQQPSAKPTYESLLERVKKSDKSVDFLELRMAYTETKSYSPYGGDRDSRNEMFAAINAKEYAKALEAATKIINSNYVDLNGHFGAFVAHRELGHTEQAIYHRYVFDGLLNSIRNSGDGKSREKAFVVISTDEEYVLLNYLGLRTTQQALLNDKGHSYDLMTALDPNTNQSVEYYFNIDKPFNWLGNSLKK